jgi:hypothetical protein
MFGRTIPALLIGLGALLYAFGFAAGVSIPAWMKIILMAYAFAFPGLLIWSYYFGPQKGRSVHFLQIGVYSAFAAFFAGNAAGYISDVVFDVVGVVLFAVLGFFTTTNYRSIRADYELGIKRDFFK